MGQLLLTDVDAQRLQALTSARGTVFLQRHLEEAAVVAAVRIDPNVVTMGSKVRIQDLDTDELIAFQLVFPRSAEASAGRISVLAPLGMAVLGRRVGDHVTWETPGGTRRLRVDRVLYQPEREGVAT